MPSWPRLVLSALGQRASRALSIFIFHRVHSFRHPLFPMEPTADEFDCIIDWITDWFQVVRLEQALDMLCAGRLRTRTACITFDDGYLDNFTTALPILRRHSVPASFFVATGYLNGGRMWNDTIAEAVRLTSKHELDLRCFGLPTLPIGTAVEKTEAACRAIAAIKHREAVERESAATLIAEKCEISDLPSDLMMSEDHVRQLYHSGMEIGAHTVTHPILARCDDETARREIADSKDHLESIVRDRIKLFAYPNGKRGKDYTERDVSLVRDLGFFGAVSTDPGASRTGDEKLELRRFTPWDKGRLRFALRLAQNLI